MGMTWTDFVTDIALERDTLLRAMPLVPATAGGDFRGTLDVAADHVHAFVSANDASMTPEGCVAFLRIRPLLFGIAWKILDRFHEEAFIQAGETPDQSRGFSIKEKRRLARSLVGQPGFLPAEVWEAVALTYDGTALMRHSMVHQSVWVDGADALVGTDSGGGRLRPVTADEQEALVHVALRRVEAAELFTLDTRTEGDLRAQLDRLKGIHKVTLAGAVVLTGVPELTVILAPAPGGGGYVFDTPYVRQRSPFRAAQYCDLVVNFRDMPGVSLRGRLEDAPDRQVLLEPDQPPDWFREISARLKDGPDDGELPVFVNLRRFTQVLSCCGCESATVLGPSKGNDVPLHRFREQAPARCGCEPHGRMLVMGPDGRQRCC